MGPGGISSSREIGQSKAGEDIASACGSEGSGARGSVQESLDPLCAGINRHGVGDESSLQERSSNPSCPRVMRRRPRGQSVRHAEPGVEALAGEA